MAWPTILGALLAFILLPFVLWGDLIANRTTAFSEGGTGDVLAAVAIVLLLAGDVVLPVPSSVVMVMAGFRFGLIAGTAVALIGMTAGCVFGYIIGRTFGRPAIERLVGEAATRRVARTMRRRGVLALVGSRAIPVLAETSVILAGITRIPAKQFLLATAAANLAIAAVYASAGNRSAETGSLLVAFAATIVFPGFLFLIHRVVARRAGEV